MTFHENLKLTTREDIEGAVTKAVNQRGAKILKALQRNGASADQLAGVASLLGRDKPVGVVTDADLGELSFRLGRLARALSQIRGADRRTQFYFRRYPVEAASNGRIREDLRAHKRALEPQLKRDFEPRRVSRRQISLSHAAILRLAAAA